MRLFIKIFFVFLLLSNEAYSQEEKEGFVLPIELGQGLQNANQRLYLFSVSLAPMIGIQSNTQNRWRIGLVANYYLSQPEYDLSFGPRAMYRWNKTGELGNALNKWLFVEATWSKDGRKLLGGGATLALNPLEFSLHPQYEFDRGQFWITTKVGVNLSVFFKKENSNDPIGGN